MIFQNIDHISVKQKKVLPVQIFEISSLQSQLLEIIFRFTHVPSAYTLKFLKRKFYSHSVNGMINGGSYIGIDRLIITQHIASD